MEKSCLIYGLERKYSPAETAKVLQQWMLIFRDNFDSQQTSWRSCFHVVFAAKKYLHVSQKEMTLSLVKMQTETKFHFFSHKQRIH